MRALGGVSESTLDRDFCHDGEDSVSRKMRAEWRLAAHVGVAECSSAADLLKLALHARKAEEKQPPQACGQEQDDKRYGHELLEGFGLADEAPGDEEGLKRTKGDDREAQGESSGGPKEGGEPCPGAQLENADGCAHREGYQKRG